MVFNETLVQPHLLPHRVTMCSTDRAVRNRAMTPTHSQESQISIIINSNPLSPTIIKSKMISSVTQSRKHSKLITCQPMPETLVVVARESRCQKQSRLVVALGRDPEPKTQLRTHSSRVAMQETLIALKPALETQQQIRSLRLEAEQDSANSRLRSE